MLLGILVLVVALALDLSAQVKGSHWDPDGLIFARMMLADRGMSPAQADRIASPFYERGGAREFGPTAFRVSRPAWLDLQFRAYRGRVLYPYLAVQLYPWFGFWSFVILSGLSFLVAAVAMYALLLQFVSPPLSAAATLMFAISSPVRGLAPMGAADELMIALGIVMLLAAVMLMRGGSLAIWLTTFTFTAFAMTFTRSWMHLPFGAAIGALCFAYGARSAASRRPAWALTAVVALLACVYALGVGSGALPSASEYLRWLDVFQHAGHPVPLGSWYAHALVSTISLEVVHVAAGGTLVLGLLCGIGYVVRRSDPGIAPLVGAGAANALAFVLHPIPFVPDLSDVFETPLLPVLTVGITLATASILRTAELSRASDEARAGAAVATVAVAS